MLCPLLQRWRQPLYPGTFVESDSCHGRGSPPILIQSHLPRPLLPEDQYSPKLVQHQQLDPPNSTHPLHPTWACTKVRIEGGGSLGLSSMPTGVATELGNFSSLQNNVYKFASSKSPKALVQTPFLSGSCSKSVWEAPTWPPRLTSVQRLLRLLNAHSW